MKELSVREMRAEHLAQAMHAEIPLLVNADAVMAGAARSIGLNVERFQEAGYSTPPSNRSANNSSPAKRQMPPLRTT